MFPYLLLFINLLAYAIMWIDKLKSIYKWWRISEKTLWIFAILGGVFGIWLGMQAPLYHKAGKRNFRVWIPVILLFWTVFIVYYFIK
ncbi:MAG: DUF1294 domain-containing protein [Candidatus Gracilibacteria bacterium]|nr:DUF1294 domain-containing protein [Candidatus Gracilibacteria bacterium]